MRADPERSYLCAQEEETELWISFRVDMKGKDLEINFIARYIRMNNIRQRALFGRFRRLKNLCFEWLLRLGTERKKDLLHVDRCKELLANSFLHYSFLIILSRSSGLSDSHVDLLARESNEYFTKEYLKNGIKYI